MAIECDDNFHGTGRTVFWDNISFETIRADYPVSFYDDFCGAYLQKYTASEDTHSLWKTVETSLNTAINLVSNDHHAAIILDVDNNAEVGCLHFGDQTCFNMERGVMFETRLTFSVLPTTGTETVQAVWGLAGAHNTTMDTVDCNAWFRLESAASTALLWEVDDNVTDDDDNAANIIMAASTWHIFRIHAIDKNHVKFYVDGALVGEGNMGGLSTTVGDVQPYFCVSKAVSSTNTGVGTMLIDYVKVWENRS